MSQNNQLTEQINSVELCSAELIAALPKANMLSPEERKSLLFSANSLLKLDELDADGFLDALDAVYSLLVVPKITADVENNYDHGVAVVSHLVSRLREETRDLRAAARNAGWEGGDPADGEPEQQFVDKRYVDEFVSPAMVELRKDIEALKQKIDENSSSAAEVDFKPLSSGDFASKNQIQAGLVNLSGDISIRIDIADALIAGARVAGNLLGRIAGSIGRMARKVQWIARKSGATQVEQASEKVVNSAIHATEATIQSIEDKHEEEDANQEFKDYVMNLSHELRTPLAALMGFIETLQGPAAKDEEARIKFLDIMAQQALRAKNIIDKNLSLSRAEMPPSGDLNLKPAIDVLNEIIEEDFLLIEGVGNRIKIYGDSSIKFFIDKDDFRSLIFEIIENSIKFSQKNAEIKVEFFNNTSFVEQSWVEGISVIAAENKNNTGGFTISDHGEGIQAEHLPRLSERFYRIDPDLSRKKGGAGLGLALVKAILKKYKGAVSVRSVEGVGSEVSVVLPIAKSG